MRGGLEKGREGKGGGRRWGNVVYHVLPVQHNTTQRTATQHTVADGREKRERKKKSISVRH